MSERHIDYYGTLADIFKIYTPTCNGILFFKSSIIDAFAVLGLVSRSSKRLPQRDMYKKFS